MAGGTLLAFAVLWVWRAHGVRVAARALAAMALPALLLVLPWLLWCWARFGHLVQDSGRALRGVAWLNLPDPSIGTWLGALVPVTQGLGRLAGGTWMLATLGVPAAALLVFYRRRLVVAAGPPLVTPPLLWVAAILLFYALVFRFYQAWYLLTPWWALALLAGWLQAQLVALGRRGRSIAAPLALGLALPVLAGAVFLPHAVTELRLGVYPWQQTYLELAERLRSHRPGCLGSFNSGIYGFFSGRPVVNLDGVVNGRAYEAIRARRLLGYIRDEARLDYVIDHTSTLGAFARFAEPELAQALLPVGVFSNASSGGPIVLWRVQRAR